MLELTAKVELVDSELAPPTGYVGYDGTLAVAEETGRVLELATKVDELSACVG